MCCGCSIVNVCWGNVFSVLVGDFFYVWVFEMMVELESLVIMNVLFYVMVVIVEGEVMQLMNVKNLDFIEDDYMMVIYNKIVMLFEVVFYIGVLLVGVDDSQE